MLNSKVKEYLSSLEIELKLLKRPYGEHCIAESINSILEQGKEHKRTREDKAEFIAFNLTDYSQNAGDRETYYGPLFNFTYEGEQISDPPWIKEIDQNMIQYWAKRARESKNPILSSRYADMVVYFTSKALNKNADIDLFHIVIDLNIKICGQLLAVPSDCKTKAKRALVLAVATNDQKRISKAGDAVIYLEKNIATSDTSKFCGLAFQWLLLDFSKKVNLDDKKAIKLVSGVEERLKKVAANPQHTVFTEDAVELLAEYYSRKGDKENLMRVLDVLENSLKKDERSKSDAFLKISAYGRMHDLYKKYARFPESKSAAKRLSQEREQLDLGKMPWMNSSFEIETDKRIVHEHLEAIFGEDETGKLKMVMDAIAKRHLPDIDALKKTLDEASNKNPALFSPPVSILSDDGMTITKFSSKEEDYCSWFKFYASQHLELLLNSRLLPITMDELTRRFTKELITENLTKSMVFESEDIVYLKRAISAYWDKDYLVSSHIFIPLIETGFTRLLRICGGSVWRQNKSMTQDRRSLGALLNNKKMEKFFDVNVLFYFKIILTERLGWNLRNEFAHGLEKKKFSLRGASDRLFHILILLSLVKKKGE